MKTTTCFAITLLVLTHSAAAIKVPERKTASARTAANAMDSTSGARAGSDDNQRRFGARAGSDMATGRYLAESDAIFDFNSLNTEHDPSASTANQHLRRL